MRLENAYVMAVETAIMCLRAIVLMSFDHTLEKERASSYNENGKVTEVSLYDNQKNEENTRNVLRRA